ncbi:hypothetical protein FCN77_13900 [Arthrobacter sp. 24S4-2]|uniref:DUF5655 domain-containing protein n=1 Tax=Arthrobacter sp. 24S4-2 TaxID=2575374 RepID=UPI0010C78E68|nr:DUF5655 domain-containing protein [Arthrobacter sp. 24S4-2]QCO98591.1 hypothetical protein FCN77_13900 [Arthrobacter sp. 24S4-2]
MNGGSTGESTPEDVFSGSPLGLELCRGVERIVAGLPPSTMRATKSQVAFRGRRGFAYIWWPARYVRSNVPAVLSIALPRRIASERFKEVVNPAPGVWMHHLELRSLADLDDEVAGWLEEARKAAGRLPL